MAKTAIVNRREQILDAALGLFAAHGIEQVTTRQIARVVGISQPSLYAHFPTRAAIAVELCRRAFAALAQRLARVAAEGGPPRARLRRLGEEYVALGLGEPAAYRVAFMLAMPDDGSAEKRTVLEAGLGAFGLLLAVFEETHGEAALGAAQSTWAGLHGLVALLLDRAEFPWIDRTTLIDLHLEALCRGALPDEPAAG